MYSSDAEDDRQKHGKKIKIQDINTAKLSIPSYSNILFSDGKTKLQDLIFSMEMPQTLKTYLQSISNINVSLPNDSPLWPGSTPLHLAVMFTENLKNDKKAVIKLINQLLDKGAKINVQNCCGATPLHLAFRSGERQLVSLLLRKLEWNSEKVINLLDNENLSSLHIFCSASDHRNSLARQLLNAKDVECSVNVVYKGEDLDGLKNGWTPLHVVVDGLQFSLLELLLERGADVFHADNRGYTVIHQSFGSTAKKEIIDVLLALKPYEEWPEDLGFGLTKLHIAVWLNDLAHIKRLLDSAVNIDAALGTFKTEHQLVKFTGCTPLHVAIIMGRINIMNILLQHGANTNAQMYDGKTALHLVMELADKKRDLPPTHVVKSATFAIINSHADVNILDWNGKSAFTYAMDRLMKYEWNSDCYYTQQTVAYILRRMQEMKLCGIESSIFDEIAVTSAFEICRVRLHFPHQNELCNELQATEKMKISKRGLSLRSFLRETHAISMYPSLIPEDRLELDNFFQSFDYQKFPCLSALIKIQYRKAVERLSLIDASCDALKTLINSGFPDVCVNIILKYLTNMQLKMLIAAALISDAEAIVAGC